MLETILNRLNIFVFAKDMNSRYLFCNENFAQVAGLDSPTQILRKRDNDLLWHEQADYFQQGDYEVLRGKAKVNALETQIQPNKLAIILVTKTKLDNAKSNSSMIMGSYVDITGLTLNKRNGYWDAKNKHYYLGAAFNGEYFTYRELSIFKCVLRGHTSHKIANRLNLSPRTVEDYIDSIKNKLQCTAKSEISYKAIVFGLTHLLTDEILETALLDTSV